MTRRSAVLACGLALVAGLLLVPGPTAADVAPDEPLCGPRAGGVADPAPWMGRSRRQRVTIPSIHREGAASFPGFVYTPAGARGRGRLPVVLLQHGLGGGRCTLEWLARSAAGHGYVAYTWSAPTESDDDQVRYRDAELATTSAFAFLRDPENPERARVDPGRVVLAGNSMGSVIASVLPGQEGATPGLRAVVALDNLRRWRVGDPGGARAECALARDGEVTPTVPALGLAMDERCSSRPENDSPRQKRRGWERWREAGLASMVLVMRGFEHADFGRLGTTGERRLLWFYVQAWLDRWVEGDRSALDRLLSPTVLGRPTERLLSRRFHSAAYLGGGEVVDSARFERWVARRGP